MKFLFPIILIFILFGCHSESKVPDRKVVDSKFIADSSKQRLLQIIEGGWVTEDYISRLRKTNSPMKACNNSVLEEFDIDTVDLHNDTLFYSKIVSLSGTKQRFNIVFSKNSNGKIIMKIVDQSGWSNQECLDFSIDNSDTILFFTGKSKNTLSTVFFKRIYDKIPDRDTVYLSPIEYAVNKNLFAGDWKLNGKTISFSGDGTVKNFKSFTRYSVKTFDENPESEPDVISFYNGLAEESFAFTIIDDRIQIYKMISSVTNFDSNKTSFERGKLMYELERVQ